MNGLNQLEAVSDPPRAGKEGSARALRSRSCRGNSENGRGRRGGGWGWGGGGVGPLGGCVRRASIRGAARHDRQSAGAAGESARVMRFR